MNISTKLNLLMSTKLDIKDSLINRGVTISDSTPFSDYASKIDTIGGIDKDSPFNYTNLPALWLDATCNTRAGFDESKPYVESLLVGPNGVTNAASYTCYYKSKTSGTWDGKFLDLGQNGAFKIWQPFYNDPMTIELVYRFTEVPSAISSTNTFRLVHLGTSYLHVLVRGSEEGTSVLSINNNTLPSLVISPNKPYYFVIRYSKGTTQIRVEPDNYNISLENLTIPKVPTNQMIGIATAQNTDDASYSTYTYSKGMQFGMLRCWNQFLSDAELDIKYQEIRNRFEF